MPAYLQPAEHGSPIQLERSVTLVGRGPDCDVILEASTRVSRMHCAFVQVDRQYYVRDLGSMNGVWIGHQRVIRDYKLSSGELIAIGDIKFRFVEGMPDVTIDLPPEPEPLGTVQIDAGSAAAFSGGSGSDLQFPDEDRSLRVELHDENAIPDCDDSATLQYVPQVESNNDLLDIDDDLVLAIDDDVEIIDDDAELD